VRVAKSTMNIDGADVLLSPGMAVTAEVTTGKRRLIEYVLSPVMEHVKESGRER
jgi:hemolysin D